MPTGVSVGIGLGDAVPAGEAVAAPDDVADDDGDPGEDDAGATGPFPNERMAATTTTTAMRAATARRPRDGDRRIGRSMSPSYPGPRRGTVPSRRLGGDRSVNRAQTYGQPSIGIGGWSPNRAHRGPIPHPSQPVTFAVVGPTNRSSHVLRRPGRKERHGAGAQRRPMDVSRHLTDQDTGPLRGPRALPSIIPGPTPTDAATDNLQLSRSASSPARSPGDLDRSSYLTRRIAFARRLTPQIPSRPRDDPPGPPLRAGVTSDASRRVLCADRVSRGDKTAVVTRIAQPCTIDRPEGL